MHEEGIRFCVEERKRLVYDLDCIHKLSAFALGDIDVASCMARGHVDVFTHAIICSGVMAVTRSSPSMRLT